MSEKLNKYKIYYPVNYDYLSHLPAGWNLLPNIAIFEERIERGYEEEELLSVTIGRGVIKQNELTKKDSSTLDKSKYLLVYPGDVVYSMRFRQGASGYSNYKGIVSPACTVLKPRKGVIINQKYFHYLFRTEFYKNYVERFSYGIADGQIPLRYSEFKRMYTIVPPIEEQNKIVSYLDNRIHSLNKIMKLGQSLIGKTFKDAGLLQEYKHRLITDAVMGIIDVSHFEFNSQIDLESEEFVDADIDNEEIN
ncbi:restriction endonuclease subunit S [Flavobacterium sp. RSB2_4_14]|uniref:restriction endonuclease subunit S n=1 Tax=Flavobacterium sp. RSB2_4_14 TaxID=3447665 RepID=UPI003F3DB085